MGVQEILDPVRAGKTGGYKVDLSQGERNGRVSSEWLNRPDDERYLSLDALWASVKGRSERSRSRVVETAQIRVEASRDSAERMQLILPKAQEPVSPASSVLQPPTCDSCACNTSCPRPAWSMSRPAQRRRRKHMAGLK